MAKELRVTFKESENHLYEYLRSKPSFSAFVKNLVEIEMKREDRYINSYSNSYVESKKEEPIAKTEFKDIVDLDISDLDI